MALKNITLRFKGISPLLMHSDKLANPLDPLAKQMKTISSKRKKTDEDHLEMAKIEWVGGMYFDDKLGPYIPSKMVRAVLVNGAKKSKAGPRMKGGVTMTAMKLPLEYKGPRDIQKLWDEERFQYATTVKVQQARIVRTRPVFEEWAFECEICYDTEVIDKAEIITAAEKAGQLCGIGDYRIEKGGDFGRFAVKEVA